MWFVIDDFKDLNEMRNCCKSISYSEVKIITNQSGSLEIETNNRPAPVHTDQLWLDNPPRNVYLYCEKEGEGGETIVGCFPKFDSCELMNEFLTSFKFYYKRNSKEYKYTILDNNGVYRFSHSHRDMLSQIVDEQTRFLFNSYLDRLKNQASYIRLKAGQGIIINNHKCFHGRTAFSGPSALSA